ncbi:MAG: DUF433 domain-containing protein [Planctomycetota bacterium]|nr:DUF433 domain-containing protein [Planctomycetota bacterium]
MNLPATVETIPLRTDADGVIRVGGTRVTLDTVVAAFEQGATAEEIAQQYPTLALPDIYMVIGHYLRHPDEVAAYLKSRRAFRDAVRRENEAGHAVTGIRERLLARQRTQRSS